MRKVSDIRDICGDYAIDIEYSKDLTFTMYFNSRRNAETVKRCVEIDDSVQNAATAVDFVEVVRCKDCIYAKPYERIDAEIGYNCKNNNSTFRYGTNWERLYQPVREADDYCSYGERKEL